MRPVRYGIIGCGMMGREHLRYLALIEAADVVALADPDAVERGRSGALVPGAALYEDWRRLLARDDLDAILIASPNDCHEEQLATILAGLPRGVLVEKPVCVTREGAARLRALAAGWSAPLWVAMEYRYMPPVAALIAALDETGGTRMLAIREHRFPFLGKVGDWNRFNARTGGTMVEKCCHFFDLMRLILRDEPVRVYASGAVDVNHLDERYGGKIPDILDNAFVTVDFAGGARAMLDLCMFAEGSYWQETIAATGPRGRVECFVPGPARFWPGGAERHAEIEISPRAPQGPVRRIVEVDETLLGAGDHHGATYYEHKGFIAAIRGEGPVAVTLEDGLRAVEIGLAAERSAAEGQAVTLV